MNKFKTYCKLFLSGLAEYLKEILLPMVVALLAAWVIVASVSLLQAHREWVLLLILFVIVAIIPLFAIFYEKIVEFKSLTPEVNKDKIKKVKVPLKGAKRHKKTERRVTKNELK